MSFPPPTPKQARILWYSLTALAVAVLLVLLGLFVWALGWLADRLSAVILPVAVALILAYILDPVVEFFVRKKMPRVWAIILVFVLALAGVGGVLGTVIPGIVRESRKVIEDLPRNTKNLETKLDHFMETSRLARLLPAGWHSSLQKLTSSVKQAPPSVGTNTVESSTNIIIVPPNNPGAVVTNTVPSGVPAGQPGPTAVEPSGDIIQQGVIVVATWIRTQLGKVTTWIESSIAFVLVPICLFYFLLEKQRINRRWSNYLPVHESKTKEEMVFVLRSINDCMIVFFRGQVLVALCVGALLAIGYLIIGLNYAVLIGVVAAVLGIVPYLGTLSALVLAVTVAAIQFGDWLHPVGVVLIVIAVKLLEDLIISPKIIGNRSGLHPLVVILAVMIGANLLGGFLGALLAVPLAAVLRTLMLRYVWTRRERSENVKSAPETGPP